MAPRGLQSHPRPAIQLPTWLEWESVVNGEDCLPTRRSCDIYASDEPESAARRRPLLCIGRRSQEESGRWE